MEDPRIRKLARFLSRGAVELQAGEKILIELHGSETGLMKALVQEAYAVGAVGQSADDLAPGEVRIRSAAAGTEIVLRNNGRIDINGLLFINGMPYLGMGG